MWVAQELPIKISARETRRLYWTVATTREGQELRTAHHVERKGFEFYLPRILALRGTAEKREMLFPGFIFVRVRAANWMPLRHARGVRRVYLCGERPSRIPDAEIQQLRAREDENGFITLAPRLAPGDVVRVAQGHRMAGLVGVVGSCARQRVQVLVEMLGQSAQLEFDVRQLEAA
jgi:transcription antitermination factor NusG